MIGMRNILSLKSKAGAYKFNENDMFNYEKLALVENKYDRTIY